MNPTPIIFTTVRDLDNTYITVYVPGESPTTIDQTHPHFAQIVKLCTSSLTDTTVTVDDVVDLFDIPKAVTKRFAQLSVRLAVENGQVLLDGDPVSGVLTDQILAFLNDGKDFGPLVAFYEKLLSNPLGDVRESLFTWIRNQTSGNDSLTITRDGDVIGYKSLTKCQGGFRPSRMSFQADRVNGVAVKKGEYIVQNVGDVVEMPRSSVLHDFSRACGEGLHVGTWRYAEGFQGDAKLAVRFNPRDVVSVPTHEGKVRVCRYTVEAVLTDRKPLTGSLYESANDVLPGAPDPAEDPRDLDLSLDSDTIEVGDTVTDGAGDEGVVTKVSGKGRPTVKYKDRTIGHLKPAQHGYETDQFKIVRKHGKGGPTSQIAKGNGLNPAQDPKTGQFVAGRPGSKRDPQTGRFGG